MTTPTRNRGTRGRRGFTLIELLIVIAVIALLLTILMPSFRSILELTHKLMCQSNLHSIGLGMQQYVADSKHYPGHCSALRHGFPYAIWPTRIRHYANGNRDIFFCASREEGFRWQEVFGSGGDYANSDDVKEWYYDPGEKLLNVHSTPFCYAYNDWGNHRYGPTDHQRGLGGDIRSMVAVDELPATGVADPSDMIAIGDSQQTGAWDFNLDPGDPNEWPSKIHSGGSSMVFCDGHVEWGLQSYWTNVNTGTPEGRRVASRWNNHNKWTDD